jgi:hypothetical protein
MVPDDQTRKLHCVPCHPHVRNRIITVRTGADGVTEPTLQELRKAAIATRNDDFLSSPFAEDTAANKNRIQNTA